VSFSWAHAGTLQNHSISPHTNTVQNNAVESSTKFYCNWQDLHDDDKTCMQLSYWELLLENGQ
jgi:hypothetical protein